MGTLVKIPYCGVNKPTTAELRAIGLTDDYQQQGAIAVWGSSTEMGDSDPNIYAGALVSQFSISRYMCKYAGYYLVDYFRNVYPLEYREDLGVYYFYAIERNKNLDPSYYIEGFETNGDMVNAFLNTTKYPITYRLTNASIDSAPTEAAAGEIVNASFTFPEGYGIVNTSSDIYVTNNGVLIPSTYVNGVLTFTMP